MAKEPAAGAAAPAAKTARSRPLRRVVTGVDRDGRSCILSDGEPTVVTEVGGVERATQIWRTEAARREIPFTAETREMESGFLSRPTPERAMFALVEFAPGDIAERGGIDEMIRVGGDYFKAALDSVKDKRHPGMHATDSIDYAILLEGELTLILDTEETILRAGDFLIQGGVSHSWINHTDKPARLLGVLLGAVRR
jgi:mannose-6-phosphate isomerase-like protein (cupin superfamily)